MSTPTEPVEMSVEEEIHSKIQAKSKGMRPELTTGAAAMYNINSYDGDYLGGGALVGRFVNNDESRIAILKTKGYDMPSAWSSRLKDLRVGSQVFMARPKQQHELYLESRRELTRQMSGTSSPQHSPDYANMAKHLIQEETGSTSVDVQVPGEYLVAD